MIIKELERKLQTFFVLESFFSSRIVMRIKGTLKKVWKQDKLIKNEPSELRYDALLKEYDSLRNEIMKRQEARFYILAFTLAVIGTVLGLLCRIVLSSETTFIFP